MSRDNRAISIVPRALVTFRCIRLLAACEWGENGTLTDEMKKKNYLAFLGRVPLLPIENADSAYVIFVELLNQSIPPKDVAMLMGSRSKVKPLRD